MLLNRGDPYPDREPVQRRAFQPPKQRVRRSRGVPAWPPADWRESVPPAFVRAVISIGFLAWPSFEDRFGALSFPVTCAALTVFAALGAYVVSRTEARRSWPTMATDAVACGLLAPVIAVAARIQVAAPELGGSVRGFTAAAVALAGSFALVAIVAAATASREGGRGGIPLLTGSLMVGVALLGAERFATQDLNAGLSLAAMTAALITVLCGLMPRAFRAVLPGLGFVTVAIATAAIARDRDAGVVSDEKAVVALLVSAIAGGSLLVVPVVTARLTSDPRSGSSMQE